ncbi:MAG: hypothetical protein AAGL49_12225 [Pseudomonadota bacterium]
MRDLELLWPGSAKFIGAVSVCALLAGCGQGGQDAGEASAPADDAPAMAEDVAEDQAPEAEPTPEEILGEVLAGDWRTEDAARDEWRNPKETLEFLGLEPGMTVVEIWPGGGWYTKVIAPYLARTGGAYIAAGFDPASESEFVQNALARYRETYIERPELYGDIQLAALSADSGPIADPGTVDMIVTFRNVHNWMAGGFAEKAYADFYAALKPGGVLGVVEHRASDGAEQDPAAANGYVRQDYVIAQAEAAGFEYVGGSVQTPNG